jgi:hypothetical protein
MNIVFHSGAPKFWLNVKLSTVAIFMLHFFSVVLESVLKCEIQKKKIFNVWGGQISAVKLNLEEKCRHLGLKLLISHY